MNIPRAVQTVSNHTNNGRSGAELRVSPTLALPHQAVTEAIAILGRRGSGKTNFGVVLVEELVEHDLPVVVLDPVGVWWGLRSGADGDRSKGLPVYVFGGEHADLPLVPTAGAELADFVVEARRPAVLDLSDMKKGEQVRFVTDFAERLYHAKSRVREALHVMIDEADAFAPQQTRDPQMARCLGAIEDLVRRGRSRGLGLSMITQRPAVLNKNVLTQAEALVVFQLTGPQDRKALDEWVNANAEEGQREAFEKALPGMPRGEAWVWSPGWLKIFERAKIRRRRTYDSSRTPEPGERVKKAVELAPVDLEALKERIASTVEEARAKDPKALRERIADLERELATAKTAPAAPSEPQIREVPVPAIPKQVPPILVRLKQRLAMLAEDLEEFAAAFPPDTRPIDFLTRIPATFETRGAEIAHLEEKQAINAAVAPRVRPARDPAADLERPRGERAILTALAQLGPLSRKRLAIVTGYAPRGGAFAKPIGELRKRNAIAGTPDAMAITDAGRKELGKFDPLPSGRALVDYWLARMGKPERRILEELVHEHPRSFNRTALAARAGYQPRGGAFAKPLATLRAYGLIRGSGEIRLAEELARALEGR